MITSAGAFSSSWVCEENGQRAETVLTVVSVMSLKTVAALCWTMWVAGCASTPAAVETERAPYLRGDDIEARELPAPPDRVKLPAGVASGDFVLPLEKGAPAPKAGLLLSEERAARDALYRVGYKELREFYEADRRVWAVHRELYEKQIELDEKRIRELTPPPPSWWDRNGTAVLVGGSVAFGLVVGASLTVGVGYALYGTQLPP